MDNDALIREMRDTQALTQLAARYGRAVDWLDIHDMKACFHPDAVVRFGPNEIPAFGFCDFWSKMGGEFKARHHQLSLPVIEFKGANHAHVEVPAIVSGTLGGDGTRLRNFTECNRYLFDVERRDGIWRIAGGRILITWSQGGPTPMGLESGGSPDHDVDTHNPVFVRLGARR